MTAKKTATKKTTAAPAKKTADPLAEVRADTPNPELTDLDRDPATVCARCGRDAEVDGLCAKHAARRPVDGE